MKTSELIVVHCHVLLDAKTMFFFNLADSCGANIDALSSTRLVFLLGAACQE